MSFSLTGDRPTQNCYGAGEMSSPDPGDSPKRDNAGGMRSPRRAADSASAGLIVTRAGIALPTGTTDLDGYLSLT